MSCNPNRRSFIESAGAWLGAAWLAPAAGVAGVPWREARLPGETGLADRGGTPQRAPWIPSDALLERLPEVMRLARVPAVSIGVIENGRIVFDRTFGIRNAETGEPADENTIFEAASLSKPAVALVAMMLRDEGLLDIDRPLVDYVEPEHLLDDPRARRITGRHVMSQSSGLNNWRRPNDAEFQLSFDPGTAYQYSGEGFVWLARVLEAVSGTGFVRLMRERLFDPLGLESTTFIWTPALADRMATGHDQRARPTRNGMHVTMARTHQDRAAATGKAVEDWTWDDLMAAAREARPDRPPMPGGVVPNAAASLLTTGSEYARIASLYLDGAPAIPSLGAESRRLVQTPHTEVEPPLAWGLGMALEERAGTRYVWHWGNNGDFHSFVIGDITGRRAIAVFANATGGPKVYERIVRDAVGFDPASLIWI